MVSPSPSTLSAASSPPSPPSPFTSPALPPKGTPPPVPAMPPLPAPAVPAVAPADPPLPPTLVPPVAPVAAGSGGPSRFPQARAHDKPDTTKKERSRNTTGPPPGSVSFRRPRTRNIFGALQDGRIVSNIAGIPGAEPVPERGVPAGSKGRDRRRPTGRLTNSTYSQRK